MKEMDIHFSVMDVRTSRLEVLFLIFCARVKISSSWWWRCSRSRFVTCQHRWQAYRSSQIAFKLSGYTTRRNYAHKTKRERKKKKIWFTTSVTLTCRRPIVVLISSTSPTVTILDLSICVIRLSQSDSSVAVLLRSVGATVSGVCGAGRWGSSLTRVTVCTAEGTADTNVE